MTLFVIHLEFETELLASVKFEVEKMAHEESTHVSVL